MTLWVGVDEHRVALQESGKIVWEHPTLPGYRVPRHMVSSVDGAIWTVVSRDPLTLSPSLHCTPGRGGCGMHGFVRDGHWIPA